LRVNKRQQLSEALGTQFIVRVLKYDGREYRHWNAKLARRDGPLIVLDAEFDVEVTHPQLGHIASGTRTVEYYWLDKWYNVFRFLGDAGQTRLWYCNVNVPPVVEGPSITYIDLDIDVLVQTDFSYQILDWDEFEYHADLFAYPAEVRESASAALAELIHKIERREFPFCE
jgi:uncharacterized protein